MHIGGFVAQSGPLLCRRLVIGGASRMESLWDSSRATKNRSAASSIPHIWLDDEKRALIDDTNLKVIELVLDHLAYGWVEAV
jgi:hypothetical protein